MAIDHFNGYCNGYDKWLMVKNSYDNPPIKRGFSGYPLVNDIEMTFLVQPRHPFCGLLAVNEEIPYKLPSGKLR